jgi:hypothetical protein
LVASRRKQKRKRKGKCNGAHLVSLLNVSLLLSSCNLLRALRGCTPSVPTTASRQSATLIIVHDRLLIFSSASQSIQSHHWHTRTLRYRAKLKKAIEEKRPDIARIHAESAIRKKNEATNFLRMSSRLDGVASKISSALMMKESAKQMGTVCKGQSSSSSPSFSFKLLFFSLPSIPFLVCRLWCWIERLLVWNLAYHSLHHLTLICFGYSTILTIFMAFSLSEKGSTP